MPWRSLLIIVAISLADVLLLAWFWAHRKEES
jgi:nitrogen fixation-related uncharacterized protein